MQEPSRLEVPCSWALFFSCFSSCFHSRAAFISGVRYTCGPVDIFHYSVLGHGSPGMGPAFFGMVFRGFFLSLFLSYFSWINQQVRYRYAILNFIDCESMVYPILMIMNATRHLSVHEPPLVA